MMCTALQNVSSVQCYLWDITLLYAQRRDLSELSQQIAHLQVMTVTVASLTPAQPHRSQSHLLTCRMWGDLSRWQRICVPNTSLHAGIAK